MSILFKFAWLVSAATLSSSSVVQTPTKDGTFELLILHNNDMHARFEQTSQLSGVCTAAERDAGKCYGGFPRVATVVKEARRAAASGEGPPVLYLNAGDTYTGTAWFTLYKWKIAAEFINAIQPDAVSLGNHEFDEKVIGVIPFIRNITSPVLAANLILDKVPELEKEKNLLKSVVITVNGVRIGIVGYLTPDTKFLAPNNDVEYEDEIVALKREVNALKNNGIKIFIALGHSGFIKDKAIARDVEDLDLVIGGHSNTFLWSSNTSNETPEVVENLYPVKVKQKSGRTVLVVQAYAYTKYMGKLHLTFDSNGEILKQDGAPILLDNSIPRDGQVLEMVKKYQNDVNRVYNKVIGSSTVFLDSERCRLRECITGDFITDAILYYTMKHHYEHYPDVHTALIQGGRIRASIKHAGSRFNLTLGDWITVLPFSDNLALLTFNGSVLRQALEHSVEAWRPTDSPGQFIQFSGMKVMYDLAKPPGSRVVKALALCSDCDKSYLTSVKDNYNYKVIMPSFIAEGGDGYTIFKNLPRTILPYNELTCVIDYLRIMSPVSPKLTGRIKILNEDKISINNSTPNSSRPFDMKLYYSLTFLFLFIRRL